MKQVELSKEWHLFLEEDQEITKTGLKKWKVQEESVHFIIERKQQQNREERDWEFS